MLGLMEPLAIASLGLVTALLGTTIAADARAVEAPPGVELNKNLLANGDLSKVEDGHPPGWVYWDPKYTRLTQLPGRKGNVIEIDPDTYVASMDGVQVYSDYIPIQEGVRYRFSVDIMTEGVAVILWIKGYGPTFYRDQELPTDEVYRSQHQLHGLEKGQWSRQTVHLLVKPAGPWTNIPYKKVTHVRVMVYAYWPVTKCYFANARFEAVEIWERPPAPVVDPATAQPKVEKPKTEQELFNDARNLFWQKKWSDALAATDQLISRHPDKKVYRFLRFRLYYRLQRFGESVQEMDALEPTLGEADNYMKSWIALFRARIARTRGDLPSARKLFSLAIDLATDPTAVQQAQTERDALPKPKPKSKHKQ